MRTGRNNDRNGPPPARGPSCWLWLVLVGLLTAGLRQMFDPGPATGDVKPPATSSATPSADPGRAAASLWQRPGAADLIPVDPVVEALASLIQALQAEDDPQRREALIADYLAWLKTEDIAAALELLQEAAPTEFTADLSRRLLGRWAGSSPQGVAGWINNLPVGGERQAAMDALAISWSNCGLTNAISWAQSLSDEGERHRVLSAVANEAMRTDPVRALQLAVGLPLDSHNKELIRRAAMEWASGDGQGAVAWAEQIPDATLRATILAGETVAWAKQDPASAATLAANELPAGRLQEDTVVSIVERWAQQQPEAAAAWVVQFPEGSLRAAAVDNLIAQWSQTDPAGAQQWLAAHS